MKYIWIIFCFPWLSFAYTQKDINLSDYGFNRYVRPNLISISQDYQTLMVMMNPELKHFKPINGILNQLKKRFTDASQ